MKKFISLLMAIVMMLSAIVSLDVTAFASTTSIIGGSSKSKAVNISGSVEYVITLNGNETRWFKFTTLSSQNYWYNLKVNNISIGNNNGFAGVSGCIYDSFDEQLVYASSFSEPGIDGAKLENNKVYYISIWGCRKGTIKFQLDIVADDYGETKDTATQISFNQYYEASIDSPGGLTDNRDEDYISGDVDYVKFNSEKYYDIKLCLTNANVKYYNTYFEGIAGIVYDNFGKSYGYIEVRPDSEFTIDLHLEKNTVYYIKFFSTSGGTGNYKFKLECLHNWDSGTIVKQASCVENGLIKYTCLVCNTEKQEVVPKTEHYIVEDKYVEPTCISIGKTEGKHCAICGLIIESQEEIPSFGHKFEAKKIKSSYTAIGYTKHTCSICGYSYKDNYTAKLKVKKPSISSLKKGKKKLTVYLKNYSGLDGVQIQYSTSKKFTKKKTKTVATKKASKTIKKLKSKKKYYVRVRGYKIVNGKKVYSSWSKVKSIKVK